MSMEETTSEQRKTLCLACPEYRDSVGCRLLRPCCRKSPWDNPYCPVQKWVPEGRFTDGDKTEKPAGAKKGSARQAYLNDLRSRGIGFHEDGGRIVVDKVPEGEMRALRFFMLDRPLDIPGAEKLREQYGKELAQLGGDCPSCEKGKLMRKYMPLIHALIKAGEQPVLAKTRG